VAFPLLGADFLAAFSLIVDLKQFVVYRRGRRRIQLEAPPAGSAFALVGVRLAASAPAGQQSSSSALHLHSSSGTGSSSASAHLSSPADAGRLSPVGDGPPAGQPAAATVLAAVAPAYQQLLQRFPDVLSPTKDLPPVKHSVEHFIETEGRPVAAEYRRLDPVKLKAAQAEFADLERQGIIRRSNSNWFSPLHMVRKQDGSWRPCGDFRRLNLQTKADRYKCPNIGDLTAWLAGCTVFSKLDLRKGYHQVPVRAEDVCKTAIVMCTQPIADMTCQRENTVISRVLLQ
jgi:hypothetical protein